jgi:hypothetical protein
LSCPVCKAAAQPGPSIQRCRCGRSFELYAGPFLDKSVVPPSPAEKTERVTVRSWGAILRQFGCLEADRVRAGPLDPITGHIPMSSQELAYRAVYTVAFWQRIPWGQAVAVLLVPLPFTLFAWWAYVSSRSWVVLPFALLMTALVALAVHSIFIIQAHFARVCGAREALVIRFDRPRRGLRRFHDELLRRCGIKTTPS